MPQCAGNGAWKTNDVPYGKGSLHSELLEATFRTRRRAKKINDGESGRLRVFSNMMQRHQNAEQDRKEKVIAKVRKTLEEMEAYKKVLGSYKADNFVTLRRGFKKRQINTPNSFRRYQLETKVYTCGFSVDTLYPEVEKTIYDSQPHRLKEARSKKLLDVARNRSNFQIDRRVTNNAMRRERKGTDKLRDPTATDLFDLLTPEPEVPEDEGEAGQTRMPEERAEVVKPQQKSMLKLPQKNKVERSLTESPVKKVGKVYFKTPPKIPPIKRANTSTVEPV